MLWLSHSTGRTCLQCQLNTIVALTAIASRLDLVANEVGHKSLRRKVVTVGLPQILASDETYY